VYSQATPKALYPVLKLHPLFVMQQFVPVPFFLKPKNGSSHLVPDGVVQ